MTVGATQRGGAGAHHRARAGGAARSTRRLSALRDRYADADPRRASRSIPRRVSGYNLDELLPEKGFHVARALVGTEGTCVTMLEASAAPGPQPAGARRCSCSATPTSTRAGDHVPEVWRASRSAWRGWTTSSSTTMQKKGIHRRRPRAAAAGRRLAAGRVRRRDARRRPTTRRASCMEALEQGERPAVDEAVRRRRRGASTLWQVRESGLRRDRAIPGERDAWPGWEDSAVPPERVGPTTSAISASCSTSYGYGASLYGHFGQGCIHTRIDFDLRHRTGVAAVPQRSSTRPPTWWSATAARSRASTATARRAASCCRRCSATSWSRPSASSRRSGTRQTG